MDTGSQQKPRYKINQAIKQVKTAGDSPRMTEDAQLEYGYG